MADSPPKAKRVKKLELLPKQLACIESQQTESGNKRQKVIVPSLCNSWSYARERAEKVQSNLAPEFPSFIKNMLHSHVASGFWLGLPRKFCDLHLPKHDAMIVLEDENGKVCESKYLVEKVGLSAGWRGFSIDHKLVEGDVLVFHLVTPFKFKVYIVRSNGSEEVDCALGLLKLEARQCQVDPTLKALPAGKPDNISYTTSEQSDKDSSDISPEVSDGIRLLDSVVAFEQVRSIEEFEILVNGLVINSELSKYLQGKYYKLCCSQRAFLHQNLLGSLNCKLVAGIISETINIADAISASKITCPVDAFSVWDKTLRAFQALGMNVGFLLSRLNQLVNLATKSERYETVRAKRARARDELRDLEARIMAARERVARLDAELKIVGANRHELEVEFNEVAGAPW